MIMMQRFFASLYALFAKPDAPEQHPPESPPDDPPPSAVARRIALVDDLRGTLARECDDYGYKAAKSSGRRTVDAALLKALEQLAEAKARAQAESISKVAEQNLLRRLQEWEALLEQRVAGADNAANKLNASLHALATTPEPGPAPQFAPLLLFTIVVWLATSLTPTAHDMLSGLDRDMKWIAGAAIALVISLAMVYGTLPSSQASGGVKRNRGAFGANIALGLAFFGLRISAAQTYQHWALAVSFLAMEVGAVWMAERKASGLCADLEAWNALRLARMQAEALVAADKADLANRQALVEKANRAISGIEDGLERAHATADAKSLIAIAVSAMGAGFRGVAEHAAGLAGAA